MEYFWCILAAAGAGIGTGLAGLSAATVMVPMLLVLCPSFSGEVGAYQATAIALMSDILGSAVTTTIYIRHKNIDLHRGWIMLVCILGMCIAGSFAAYAAGNVILGGFSLFLTFFIGIRFLVKPETEHQDKENSGSSLDKRGIAISLFFGLTIGFGTGFVGTGGGMMMLIVFTSFLGIPYKTAVGTSTFIMTFTALIASVSHVLIEPSIILEQWRILVICVAVETAASLLSAQYANRVRSRTVSLVTGAVLVLLGGSMILLQYWNRIIEYPLLSGTLICIGRFLSYILIGATVLILIHVFANPPSYLFRKLLHIVAFTSIAGMMFMTQDWYIASLTALFFAVVVYPILCFCEKYSWYDGLFVQKEKGEVKKSLVLLFTMIAVVIAFTWGLLNERFVAVTSVLMWGTGDAAAAIIGIRFGKHVVKWRVADGKKTWEGSTAMFLTAFIIGSAALAVTSSFSVLLSIAIAFPAALVGTFTELASKKGNDTVTVPVAVSLVLCVLSAAAM